MTRFELVNGFLNVVMIYCQKQPPEVFCKKGIIRIFAKFTGKHLCLRLFFIKVTEAYRKSGTETLGWDPELWGGTLG